MADAQLSVELTAKIDGFVDGLNKATQAAEKANKSVSGISSNISRNVANIGKQNISAFNSGVISISKNTQSANKSIENLASSVSSLPQDFSNANSSISTVVESINEVGGAAEESGVGVSDLIGLIGGGVSLASAMTVVTFAIGLYAAKQKELNKIINDSKLVGKEYIETLDLITGLQLKGAESAQKELTDLKLLYQAYTNSNISLADRKKAYTQLQEQYPQYFGNIKFEKEATDRTKQSYDLLTQSILATARARAASDKITQNETRKLENEQKTINLQNEQIKNLREQDKLQRSVDANISSSERGDSSGASEAIDLLRINSKVNENLITRNNLKTDSNLLDKENARLVDFVNNQLEKGAKITGGFGDALDKLKGKSKDKSNPLELLIPDNPDKIINDFFRKISAANAPGALKIQAPEKVEIVGKRAELEIGKLIDITGIDKLIRDLKIAEAFNAEASKILSSGVVETFASIGQAIGDAVVNGGDLAAAAGSALLSSLGGVLIQLGELAIGVGVGIKAIQTALASLNPIVAIAAGVALVALGSVFKAGAANIGKGNGKGNGVTAFANGGIISGPTLGLMGEYAGAKSDPEVVAPLSKLKKMLGQQDSAGNPITPANQQPVYVQQRLEIQGTKLVALIDTVESQNKRRG